MPSTGWSGVTGGGLLQMPVVWFGGGGLLQTSAVWSGGDGLTQTTRGLIWRWWWLAPISGGLVYPLAVFRPGILPGRLLATV